MSSSALYNIIIITRGKYYIGYNMKYNTIIIIIIIIIIHNRKILHGVQENMVK